MLGRVSVCFARLDVRTGLQFVELVEVGVVLHHQLVVLGLIVFFIRLPLQCLLQLHLFFLGIIEVYLFGLRCGLGPLRCGLGPLRIQIHHIGAVHRDRCECVELRETRSTRIL